MQKERNIEGEVKVDRVKLQEQLCRFHLEKEKMKSKGVDHTTRFCRGDDLRMTGSGDHRSTSPTLPLNLRVSGKERRRRVHAWLGSQIGSDGDSLSDKRAPVTPFTPGIVYPDLPAPETPSFGKGLVSTSDGDKGDPGLLCSNSEFLPGSELSPKKPHYQHTSSNDDATCTRKNDLELLTQQYCARLDSPFTDSTDIKDVKKKMEADFSGGGDQYCYIYDPIIARAYTKKYPIDLVEGSNIKHPKGNCSAPKYAPASQNFTPSPAPRSSALPHNVSRPDSTDKYHNIHSATPYSSSNSNSFHFLPTKYEEYDMRPIKPLDAITKRSLYGETCSDVLGHSKTQQPHPYLRRSHTTGVSYPVPKPGARTKEKSNAAKQAFKIQSNIEAKKRLNAAKGSRLVSPSTPRKVRRSPKDKLPDLPSETDKSIFDDSATAEDSKNLSDKNESVTDCEQLPVDLKHVKAATKIQAVWRGYRARKLNPKVVEIRQEVRSRRAEQYISVLCHEVQCLKENLDAERKMRDLQTEAIRYIWAQLRMLQKRKGDRVEKFDGSSRKKASERKPRSKSSSPRRGMKRTNTRASSPQPTPRSAANKFSQDGSKALDYNEETDSIDSSDDKEPTPKPADVSWKEVADDKIFENRLHPQEIMSMKKEHTQQSAEDTDEGRGTLVTDGEGNPAHSSAEDDLPTKASKNNITQNAMLRSTIDVLQEQVSQLQEAMLALSDKIINRDRGQVNLDVWDEEDDLKLVSESQDATITIPTHNLEVVENDESKVLEKDPCIQTAPEPAMSARGDVPRISLKNALTILKSALSENELWAICEQAGHDMKSKTVKKYHALETTYLRKDGRIEFEDISDGEKLDDMYLAPEILDNKSNPSFKSSVFSLSVVLWSAADWEMSADQAPQLSDELESLLVVMSQDDPEQRAPVEEVIKICEDHHAKARLNSLCVCSSLFAEIQDALILAKSGKVIQKKIALEVSRDQEMNTKKLFKESVLPDINSCQWRSKLKPAADRVLTPRPAQQLTPHEMIMESINAARYILRKSPRPKVFSVRDMFIQEPELVHKLNILPGQRRKNQKAMRLVMRRQSPKDPYSAPMPGVPTPPKALRAGVSDMTDASGHSSVILRWHPSKVFTKHGQEAKEKLVGYRIYVNGHPKGMVAGTKSRALLEGLRHSTEYRVHVRAVSSLGESDPSNIVIAHITSSPSARGVSECSPSHVTSPVNTIQEDNASPPVPTARKSNALPQVKPRLGAVFPEAGKLKQESKRPESTSDRTSSSDQTEKSDDIIDRVLKRYGIEQTAAIVPSFASGSTLSPMPLGFKSKTCSSAENKGRTDSNISENVTKSLASGGTSTKESGERSSKGAGTNSPLSPRSADITRKSLELLTQLKTDLLS